jgi:hypothetical protein
VAKLTDLARLKVKECGLIMRWERKMPKERESAADRLWKEKREECAITHAAVALALFVAPCLLALLIVGWS